MSDLQKTHFCTVDEALHDEAKATPKVKNNLKISISTHQKLFSSPEEVPIAKIPSTNDTLPFSTRAINKSKIKIKPPISPKPNAKSIGFFEKNENLDAKKNLMNKSKSLEYLEARKIQQQNEDALERYASIRPVRPLRGYQRNPPPDPPTRLSSLEKNNLKIRKPISIPNISNLKIDPIVKSSDLSLTGKSNRLDSITRSIPLKKDLTSEMPYELENYDDFIFTKDEKQTNVDKNVAPSKINKVGPNDFYVLENYGEYILIEQTDVDKNITCRDIKEKEHKDFYELENYDELYVLPTKPNLDENSNIKITDEDLYTPMGSIPVNQQESRKQTKSNQTFYHRINQKKATRQFKNEAEDAHITTSADPHYYYEIDEFSPSETPQKVENKIVSDKIFVDFSEESPLAIFGKELLEDYNRKKK